MHSPTHSEGERRMHPSTPCSASMEWGGCLSTLEGSARSVFCRRLCLKSTGTPLGAASVAEITRGVILKTFSFVPTKQWNLTDSLLCYFVETYSQPSQAKCLRRRPPKILFTVSALSTAPSHPDCSSPEEPAPVTT